MVAVRISRVSAETVIDLRHRVLRAGLPRASAVFPGDELPEAIHLAAKAKDDSIVGVASLLAEPWQDQPAWRLRGMAVDPVWQGRGVGAALLVEAMSHVRQSDRPLAWCTARLPVRGFYLRHGWREVGEVFDIPTAGPHVRMVWRLA